jgi:uncharacterized protein (TIGR02246 family)
MQTEECEMATVTADKAVLGVLDGMYAAWAAGDVDGIARHYTQDATVVMPGVFDADREAVRAFFTVAFAGRLKGSTTIDEPQDVRFYGPDTAVVISTGGIVLAGQDTVMRQVRATWTLVRQDGDWLIAAYANAPVEAG